MTAGGGVLEPRTREELAAIVEAAFRERVPLFVTGGGTPPADAGDPTPPRAARASGTPDRARVVSTRGLDRVIAHEPGDLTLTVEGGVTVKAAQELLAGHRQFLAFEPNDPGATIGAVIASGRDGPLATRFGLVRDQVLGLAVVNGDGKLTRCGGRVVKNVTGYDLCRLYAGSGGGLGIIVEATLRVRPQPEAWSEHAFGVPDAAAAFERAFEIRRRVPEIAQVEIAVDAAGAATLITRAAGSRALTEALDREIAEIMGEVGVPGPPALAGQTSHAVDVAVLPTRLPELHAAIAPLLSPASALRYDVLRGVRRSWHVPGTTLFPDPASLDALLSTLGATLDCPNDPGFAAGLCARFPGQTPGGLALMRSLKAALDPAGILNPGRNVYG